MKKVSDNCSRNNKGTCGACLPESGTWCCEVVWVPRDLGEVAAVRALVAPVWPGSLLGLSLIRNRCVDFVLFFGWKSLFFFSIHMKLKTLNSFYDLFLGHQCPGNHCSRAGLSGWFCDGTFPPGQWKIVLSSLTDNQPPPKLQAYC